MLMVLLYFIAVMLETGMGVWIFGKMFPMRKKGREKRKAIWILYTLLIFTTYTLTNSYHKISAMQKQILLLIYILGVLIDYIIYKSKKDYYVYYYAKILFLFVYMTILVTWQYWTSYLSFYEIITGNIYIVFFIYAFFECKVIQAYLWEVLWLLNLGILKMFYIMVMAYCEHKNILDYIKNYRYVTHQYIDILFILGICCVMLILYKLIYIAVWMQELLKKYLKYVMLIFVCESILLWLFMEINYGELQINDLLLGMSLIIMIFLILLGLCIHFFFYSIVSQKKILEVKNDSIIKQYDELSDSIHKYKCIIHDQKYFFNYVEEMLKDRQSEEIQNTLANYQKCFGERYYWTGIEYIDNVITIEKRKMDAYQIEFQVEFSIDDIYIEPMDLVIIMENLLENAIEAASKCELKRKIVFELKNINDVLLLKIWNTSCKFPHVKNDKFVTDKREKNTHGWGIESVKNILEKYDGKINFEYDNNYFEVVIII